MLSSADLLLISNALDTLGEKIAVKVLNVLKDFVTHGYLDALCTANVHMSGRGTPKTVIISSKIPMIEALCDHRVDLNPPCADEQAYGAVDGMAFGELSPKGRSEWAFQMSQRKQDIVALCEWPPGWDTWGGRHESRVNLNRARKLPLTGCASQESAPVAGITAYL